MNTSLPHTLGHYSLEHPLGTPGLHGRVGKYRDEFTERHVAIKILSEAGTDQQVWGEAEALAALDSEHLVRLLHAHQLPGGQRALVMTYVEGCDLTDIIADGPPNADVIFSLLCQLYQAVDTLHRQAGLIHGDLKPANIRVTSPDPAIPGPTQADEISQTPANVLPVMTQPLPAWRLVVLDLGLSVKVGRCPARAGGTPPYRAPEQTASVPWERPLDWWAFGLIAAQLITGVDAQAAYREASAGASMLAATRAARDRLLEALDRVPDMGLHELVRRLLADDPAERPDTVRLRSVFRPYSPFLGNGPSTVTRENERSSEAGKPWFRGSRRNVLAGAAGGLAAFLAVAFAVGSQSSSSSPDAEPGRTTPRHDNSMKTKASPVAMRERHQASPSARHPRSSRSRHSGQALPSAKGAPASPARARHNAARPAARQPSAAREDQRPESGARPKVRQDLASAPPVMRPPAAKRANIRFSQAGAVTATVYSRNPNALFRHDFGLKSPDTRKGCRGCVPGDVMNLGEISAGTVTFYLDVTPPSGGRFGASARFLSTDKEHARVVQINDSTYRIAWEDYNDANFIDLVVDVTLKRR